MLIVPPYLGFSGFAVVFGTVENGMVFVGLVLLGIDVGA
jgi:hypothetical protein